MRRAAWRKQGVSCSGPRMSRTTGSPGLITRLHAVRRRPETSAERPGQATERARARGRGGTGLIPTAGRCCVGWWTHWGRCSRGHDHAGDARCGQGLRSDVHRGQPRPAPGLAHPAGSWTGREPDLNDRQLDARRRAPGPGGAGRDRQPGRQLHLALVGLQQSIREWALRQGWCGRSVDQKEAKGILIAALGMLARHYGYSEAKRAS